MWISSVLRDRKFAVHHLYGHDVKIANMQGVMRQDLMQSDGRHAWITMFCEAIGQHLEHGLLGLGICIDIDLAKLTIRADVIHASHVVVVGMGDQDAVYLTKRLREYLLAEVWATVYEQTG